MKKNNDLASLKRKEKELKRRIRQLEEDPQKREFAIRDVEVTFYDGPLTYRYRVAYASGSIAVLQALDEEGQ
jgi:hypothetical protein